MGCSSCSTDGKVGGCKSNGTCGTDGCNKLNVYNWLSETITGTKDTNAALKMQLLAEQLAGIDQKKKGALYSFYQASGNVISKTVNTILYW